jgi:hypothetical protein
LILAVISRCAADAARAGAAGDFDLPGLTPGDYTVIVNAPGHGPQQQVVRVGPGATARIEFMQR